jgi:hypothetical protein
MPADLVLGIHRGRAVVGRAVDKHLPYIVPWTWVRPAGLVLAKPSTGEVGVATILSGTLRGSQWLVSDTVLLSRA